MFTIITGASGGLGKSFVYQCAKRSENLVLTSRNKDQLETIKKDIELNYKGVKVFICCADLAKEESRTAFWKTLSDNNIVCSKLINNAGFIDEGGFLSKSEEHNLQVIRVNCEGTIDMTQKFLNARDKSERAFIITISSLGAFYSMPNMAMYSATKSMLKSFFVSLREELKSENVFITTVCPAGMPTTDEMKKSIKSQGFMGKWTAASTDYVAETSLKSNLKNKAIVIPKCVNKVMRFLSRFVSEPWLASMLGKRWKKAEKKRDFKS